MKRQGYLFEKMCDIDNLKEAIINASKGKKSRKSVQTILSNIDEYALNLQKMLIDRDYTAHIDIIKKIYTYDSSKKNRKVCIPKFYPDLCIQWAMIQVLEPVFKKGMYAFTCSGVPGRGIHRYAMKYLKKWLKNDRKNTKYCLQIDIKKYYESINTSKLKIMLRRKIKDKKMLWLLDNIIDVQDKGLPLGYYTSNWLANFYLEGLDHYIKEKLGVVYMMRYNDDIIMLGRNKKALHKVKLAIDEYLSNLDLTIKDNWQVYRVDKRAIDFLGYRFFRNHILLRKSLALKIKRKILRASKKQHITLKMAQGIVSYLGWTKWCNSYNFYIKNIKQLIDIKKVKGVISFETSTRNLSRAV